MPKRDITPSPIQPSTKRLPIFSQRGMTMREGDHFKVAGRHHWFRFTAYVIPDGKAGYVEGVELKQRGKTPPHRRQENLKTGGVRCIDPSTIRETFRTSGS